MNTNISSNSSKSSWRVDPIYSNLSFSIKHLMISNVTGDIKSFDLTVQTSGHDFGEVTALQLTADMASLTTNHEPRDMHLRSQDFFDVAQYPAANFEGVFFEKQGQVPRTQLSPYCRDYKLRGKLTIKGVANLVLLAGEFGGLFTSVNGEKRASFTLKGTLSRAEFGLSLEGYTDAGNLILADEVHIFGNIQLIKEA